MLTRKDFELAAFTIAQIPDKKKRDEAIAQHVNKFKACNPRFNEGLFRDACVGTKVKTPKVRTSKVTPLPSFVTRQNRYQVSFESLVDPIILGENILSLNVNGHKFNFESMVRQSIYPKGHAWAGQVQGTWVDIREVYETVFGAEYNCGTHRDWDGMVCAGSYNIDVIDFLSGCLFQIKADHTEACTNLMGPWIAYNVDMEEVPKFEKALAHHIATIKAMSFHLRD